MISILGLANKDPMKMMGQ